MRRGQRYLDKTEKEVDAQSGVTAERRKQETMERLSNKASGLPTWNSPSQELAHLSSAPLPIIKISFPSPSLQVSIAQENKITDD